MRAGVRFEPSGTSALTQACGSMKSTKHFRPRPAACVTAEEDIKLQLLVRQQVAKPVVSEDRAVAAHEHAVELTATAERDRAFHVALHRQVDRLVTQAPGSQRRDRQ